MTVHSDGGIEMTDRDKLIEQIYEAIDYGVCVDLLMDVIEFVNQQDEEIQRLRKQLDEAMLWR